jgi:hypothetical protein
MPEVTETTLFDLDDAAAYPRPPALEAAIRVLSATDDGNARGAVFTRREVVDFILDLIGYSENAPLHNMTLLEPSFGSGDFLLPIIGRLLSAWRTCGGNVYDAVAELSGAVCAVELHKATFDRTRLAVIKRLVSEGLPITAANEIAGSWLKQEDFLLVRLNRAFDFVAGNPPYVRQERIPAPLLEEYRRCYKTMYDRADMYVPFIERALSLLSGKGVLGFICADRWTKNRYGGPLRGFISNGFHLRAYVDMVNTDAFHSEVSAYPAITIIDKSARNRATRVARQPEIERKAFSRMARDILADTLPKGSPVFEIDAVVNGQSPWLLGASSRTQLIRRIEAQFPALETAGCRIGIGVATGADSVFIGDGDMFDVEPDRKIPLVTTQDIQSGEIVWRGRAVLNPFSEKGALVPLADYPRLSSYLQKQKALLSRRHCAEKSPANWYRTIDRIWPALTQTPKLLIPDIKGGAHVVFDSGKFYPHHNLYYVVSDSWDLRALQAVLLSSVTKVFVETYSTSMRGGYLRFQAQYLRRIRLPFWRNVPERLRRELCTAAHQRDIKACDEGVCELYRLTPAERDTLSRAGGGHVD